MATRTYILAPNLTYKRTGSIQVGNIISDPFRPAKPLSQPAVPPYVETVFQYNHEATRQTGRSLRLSLWAQVLDTVGVSISVSRAQNVANSLSIDRLETQYLPEEPADGDAVLNLRLKEPRVQAAIRSGLLGRAPVYLISGIKIARGLVVRSEASRTIGGSLAATVPAAQAVGVDLRSSLESDSLKGTSVSFAGGEEDVVVAYQVHVIKVKGRSRQSLTAIIFESDAAFLHADELIEEQENLEIGLGDVAALKEVAQQMEMVLESEEVRKADGGSIVCVQASDI